jgi:hypothetical protein
MTVTNAAGANRSAERTKLERRAVRVTGFVLKPERCCFDEGEVRPGLIMPP